MICGLARASVNDIDKAWEAVRHAAKPRIHVFLATSEIHMKYKLRMTREQVVERVREMVTYARQLCDDVEFSLKTPDGAILSFYIMFWGRPFGRVQPR